MHHPRSRLLVLFIACLYFTPELALAQASPFMTGATALQTNILAWLTPVAIIDGLKDALARLRKFGGRCVLGFQSVAQVSGTYGHAAAQTVIENCSNTLILRCAGSENGGTSQFASRLIGDREMLRPQTSRGRDRDEPFSGKGSRRSRHVTEQRVTEAAVMPSELEQLPDLTGYLKTASSPAWRKVHLSPY
jgi:type IV secretory pathway TraG/TraD family ATPase VirD4